MSSEGPPSEDAMTASHARAPQVAATDRSGPERPSSGVTVARNSQGGCPRGAGRGARWEGARLAHPGGETPPLPLSAVTAARTPGLGDTVARNSQPRHCEEQSDEATHAAACLLRKKSLRLLLATKGGGTPEGATAAQRPWIASLRSR